MVHRGGILLCAVCAFLLRLSVEAQICDLRLSNSYLGKEFWLILESMTGSNRAAEVIVLAPYGAQVRLTVPEMGYQSPPVEIQPGGAYLYSTLLGTLPDFLLQEQDHGRKIEKVVHIVSDNPVTVEVRTTAVNAGFPVPIAYQIYPASVWGTYYRYVLRPNNHVWGTDEPLEQLLHPKGVMIIAKEDGTKVTIRLQGQGAGWIRINGQDEYVEFPRDRGKVYTAMLNAGEAYGVCVTGWVRPGQNLDLTGTEISSSAPVLPIMYHEDTPVPFDRRSQPGPAVEMFPPVGAWGKRYVVRSLRPRGDDFRVIAAEDSTYFEVRWYDEQTGQLRGQWSGFLRRAGDYQDYAVAGDQIDWISGYAVWEATKPILVVPFGGPGENIVVGEDELYGPTFLWAIAPEQYVCEHYFYIRPGQGPLTSREHLLHLLVAAGGDVEKIRSIRVNGEALWQQVPGILGQRVPGTGQWAIRLSNLTAGGYHLQSDALMGVMLYSGQFRGYGDDAATSLGAWNRLGKLDTEAPRLQRQDSCGIATVTARDDSLDLPYEDTGISRVELLSDRSYNYRLRMISPPVLENRGEGYWRQVRFRLEVIDPSRDGKAVYGVVDWRGNVRLDSVVYDAPEVALSDTLLQFGSVRVGTKKQQVLRVVNQSDSVVEIDTVWLQRAAAYRIVAVTPPLPAVLASGDTLQVVIEYEPKRERTDETDWERDTVAIVSACARWQVALEGQGVQPHIAVGDWNARQVAVGEQRCNSENLYDFAQTIRIENRGSAPLRIDTIRGVEPPFFIAAGADTFPLVLAPGEVVYWKGACFAPQVAGQYEIQVEFVSDAPPGDDNISVWKGEGIAAAPYITGYDWGWQRMRTVHSGQVVIGNGGSNAVRIDTVVLEGQVEHFRITGYEFAGSEVATPKGIVLNPQQEVVVRVAYEPQVETAAGDTLRAVIRAVFADAEPVAGELRGQAYVPKIGAEGYRFECVELGKESAERGEVKIWNAGSVWQLQIWSVEFDDGVMSDPQAFWAENWVQFPVTLDVGDTLRLGVRFRARTYPSDSVRVRIWSDAAPGPEEAPRVESGVMVRGCAEVVGLEVEGTTIGPVLGCDGGEGAIVVRNAGSVEVEVADVRLAGGDVSEFVITGPKAFTLGAGEEQRVGVRLLPGEAGEYSVMVAVESSVGVEQVEVRGRREQVGIGVWVEAVDEAKLPGEEAMVRVVYADSSGKAKVEALQIELEWDGRVLGYRRLEAVEGEWEVIDEGIGKVRLAGQRSGGFGSGEVVRLWYGVYGGTDREAVEVKVSSVDVGDRAVCVEAGTGMDTVRLGEYCLREVREIRLGKEYGLEAKQEGEEVVIRYGIGLSGAVEVVLYDGYGRKETVIARGQQEAGWREVRIGTEGLSSGIHFVRLRSGRYMKVVPVWVVK